MVIGDARMKARVSAISEACRAPLVVICFAVVCRMYRLLSMAMRVMRKEERNTVTAWNVRMNLQKNQESFSKGHCLVKVKTKVMGMVNTHMNRSAKAKPAMKMLRAEDRSPLVVPCQSFNVVRLPFGGANESQEL